MPPKSTARPFRHVFKDGIDPALLVDLPGPTVLRGVELAQAFAPRSPLTEQLLTVLADRHTALREWIRSAVHEAALAADAHDPAWTEQLEAFKRSLAPDTVFGEIAAHARTQTRRRDPPVVLLEAFITSGDVASRWAALDALFDYGSPEDANVDLARGRLTDASADIRKLACFVLGSWHREAPATPASRSIAVLLAWHAQVEADATVKDVARWGSDPHDDAAAGPALQAWHQEARARYCDVARYETLGLTPP
jgi:hypothetical protein